MKREHCTLWLLQTLLVLLPPGLPAPCPRPCSCPHPAELHCTFRSLLSVPGAVSRHVKRVNLGFNSIGHIGVGSLSGLKRLELLMVHGNNIHSLPDGAFRDLASLQMLKMSYNKLKEINRRTFHGLWSLSRLHLDHNQLELIHPDAFQGLTSLRFLQLEGNRLQQLHATTFSTFALRDQFYISTLRHLHLSDNGLTSLPSQLLGTMPHLESLYLHGNPWTCDCGMSWFHDWEKDSPGVLKCKKDRDLPGGQLCPSCSSPRPLKDTDLHAAAPLVCSSPVISLLHGTSPPPESERQMLTSKDFKDPIGNISMGLSDEHGNKLDLECSVDELQEPSKVSWEQVSKLQLLANVSLSVELQCAVDRKKYEQLWKAIAYYSNVPAHLKRGPALTKDPELAYAYEQDSELDAGYYTGLKVQMWARPAWLMQPSVELQLNRAESSIRTVILALRTTLSELVETEQQQRLGRTWVMIDSTNRTRKVMSAILGSPSEMFCNVRSSDPAEIRWTLPDGSELASPYSGPGNRVSVSRDGRLRIKAVTHSDTGTFYCMAKVPGDVAVLSFYLSVQESSSPPPGDDTSAVSMEEFAGNPISMDCPASSSPDAEINWILPSSQIVHSQDNSSKALVHFNGSLHISKTQVSDSGYYKCVAINQHGADTMVKKVSIVRRNGLIRPLRRFPVRPQSASGVSTQVKIPTENAEEASGDVDASTIRHRISGVRRRIPGNLAPGGRGIHPSRSTWQRRTMLRGSHTENQNGSAENRRRIHLSKSKIDPKKWAHILAKARERDAVSPLPASYPTKIEKALTTESLKTPDKSSDGVTVHGSKDQQYLPEQSTEPQIKEFPPHGEDDHVTTESYSERGAANNSRHLTTAPHPTESAYTAQRTTQHTEPNLVTSSDSGFSLPQTTSVPPHGITISQPSARTASGSTVQTADPSEGRQSGAEPDDVISSINHRLSLESQTNSVKREGSGNYLGETSTLSQFEPKDTTESRSEVKPSKSPSTAPKPPGRRKSESNRRPLGSKRRNGGRRKRPNRKKEKLDASNTIRPAAKASISELNTEQPRVTVGPSSAVPSTGSQAASSSRLSHKESSVLRQNHKALTETFPLPETKDGRLLLPRVSWQSSTAAPSLPALTHGNSMLGTAEVFPSALLRSADTLEDSYETSFTTEPAPLLHYDRLTGRYDSLTEWQRVHQATGMETSTQPSQFTSTASSTAGGQKAASRETSRGILSTSRRLPKHRNHSSGQKEVTKTDLTPRENQQTSLNAWTDVMRSLETAVASITSTLPPRVLLPHSHRQSTSQDTTIAGRDVITSNFPPTTFPTNHKLSNTSPAVQVSTSIPPPTVVSPTPFQRTPVRPQGSTQEERTPVHPQGSTQEEQTPVRPQGSTQEEWTPVRPQGSTQEEWTPVRPQGSTQEEGTPVHPQVTSQEERTPVHPQVSTQEEGTPVRPQMTTQEEQTPVRPQATTQEERTLVSKHEEGTPVHPQGSTQEEGTPVRPKMTIQEERTRVRPQGSTQEEGTLVRPKMTIKEERTPVRPQGSTQEDGTPVRPQGSTQEEGTPARPQVTTHEDRTLVSTQEKETPVHPQVTSQEERTPVHPQVTSQGEGTPVHPQVSTQEERTPVHPQVSTQEEGTPVHQQMSTQEEGTPVHQQMSTQEEGTPVRPHVSTQEEGTPVHQQMSTQEEQTLGHTSNQRGKPRITTDRSQTITVRTGADAQLPCDTEGQPMPFLSWTKASSGVSIAKNMRWQRLEVHHNGTLIIRNSQETDAGRYLCTVQNQYGTDTMTATLLVSHQPPLRDIHVYEGGKAELECKVAGDPRVSWILPNSVQLTATSAAAPSPPQRLAVDEMGTLLISSAHLMDAGIYRCSVPGGNGVPVRLRVSAVPALIEQEKDQTVVVPVGGPAYIHCAASTASRPIIRWIAPGGMQLPAPHPPNGGNFIVFPNGTLHIKRLASKDSGRYICTAGNAAASSSRAVILRVISKPSSAKATITASSSKTTDVTYGSPLLLNCVAAGEPEPRIIWRTPSKKLVDHQFSFDSRIKVFLNGSLSIHSVTDKDRGDYLCVARNKMGDDYIQLRVNVLTKPAKIEQKMQKSSQEVIRGQDLKVDCVASGLPSPEISWALPDGTMVNPVKQRARVGGGRSRRYVVFDNGTLYFNEVGLPEEGDYICYAQNQLGKDEMKVRVRVKGGTTRPQIQDKGPKTVQVLHGETVTLQCKAIGDPVPVVTWMSPKNRLISPDSNKYQVLQDGSLVVQKVQGPDGGNYTCLARSSVGQDDKVTRVEVLPTPPVINGLRGDSDTMEVTAVQGERTLVDCATKGAPSPQVMWILPGNVILPAPYYSNHRTVHPNGTLEIRSTQRTDSGQMVCVARNEGGEVRMLVHLEVKETVRGAKIEAPEKESFALRVGNSVTLNCTIDGLELTHLTWILPDGTPLHTGARISKFFHRLDGSLVISNPSVAEAGVYRCMGRNPAGLFESTITLSPGRKPQILNRYISPVSVLDGETLFLHCQTTGEPLRLTWTLPSGVVLNRLQNAGRYSILQNGTIAIRQASIYDRGAYVCRAANEYGSSLLSVSVKIVANQPRITRGPPSVTYAKHGVAVQLNCATAGTPAAEVSWETPDKVRMVVSAQPRLFGNKYLHPQGSLIIQNPTQRDSGVYRCTARNAAGVDSKTTFLNVF